MAHRIGVFEPKGNRESARITKYSWQWKPAQNFSVERKL